MFAPATDRAARFTYPVLPSSRRWDGRVEAAVGAFVVVNADGWIVTAAHVFSVGLQAETDRPKIDEFRAKVDATKADAKLPLAKKNQELRRLERSADPNWITAVSYVWGRPGLVVGDLTVIPEADIAVGRLDPFPQEMAANLPVLKNPTVNFDPATSLCRLGFPFHKTSASYDPATNTFNLSGTSLPTLFPIDGIFTRTLDGGRTSDGKHPLLFVETSSPGLLGQSGGPIYDSRARVWAVQSRTAHVPLGFNPTTDVGGKKTVVPQFMNLGVGVHAQTVISILADLGVSHEVSPD